MTERPGYVGARGAVAVATALVPVFQTEGDVAVDAWIDAQKVIVGILEGTDKSARIEMIGSLAALCAALAVRLDPDDPYAILQKVGTNLA